jgi:hypothetical protein
MEVIVRKTRTLKPTELSIPPGELALLAQLWGDPRYDALLNIMERACISLDTAHLETPIADPATVLGGHCVCKGAWQFFVYVQKQVEAAYNMRAGAKDETREPTLEELLQGVEGIPVEE